MLVLSLLSCLFFVVVVFKVTRLVGQVADHFYSPVSNFHPFKSRIYTPWDIFHLNSTDDL